MRDLKALEESLDKTNVLEMAIYHECLRLQKHLLYHYEHKDVALASMYGIMTTSLSAILSEKTGRMTSQELNKDNDEFDKY
jgi:hypothetical protein